MNGVLKIFVKVSVFIFVVSLCVSSFCFSADTTKAPSVFFPQPLFEFNKMVEGEDILHDFVIMNKGTDVLKVEKVKTTCGCTTVSYSREIPPNGEGKITMKVNTRGYGGRKLTKAIGVITNDSLVEKKPQIGGVMAQLDKTFPTNDCAMRVISPKLVEAGRHLNIDLHTMSEVEEITGESGNFKVTLTKKARYVDLEKCTACGECSKVCPVDVPNMFDQGLRTRKAVFKLYPQGMPGGFAIDKSGICSECYHKAHQPRLTNVNIATHVCVVWCSVWLANHL